MKDWAQEVMAIMCLSQMLIYSNMMENVLTEISNAFALTRMMR